MKKVCLLVLSFLFCMNETNSQINPDYAARLQVVLDSMCNKYSIKGASAAIIVPGKGIWTGVHGLSYAGVPINSGMAFPLNSNTKTYIAALMLKLQEDGALQLSDTIGTWIHNKTNINGQITIRQLLNHTSGLYSYTDSAAFSDSLNADYSRIWQPYEMLSFIGPPLFAPGTSWSYSNTNYLLAGMIISQVCGMPIEQAVRSKLFNPQGLSQTWYYPQERPTAVIPHFWFYDGVGVTDGLVYGYTPEAFYSAASSAGAIFSTASDNALFWQKLSSGQIINSTSMAQWRQMVTLNSNIGYGLGVFRYRNFNGHVIYEHGGTGAGAINENLVDSATGVCISLLTNQDSADNNILLNQVIRVLHKVTLNAPTEVYAGNYAPSIKWYPNPAQDELHISFRQNLTSMVHYSIADMSGREILTRNLLPADVQTISIETLKNGYYVLNIISDGNILVSDRFIVWK